MASPTNVRFPDPVDKHLSEYARKVGAKKSSVVVGALREWLRMEAHPGIVFVTTVTGERRAALVAGPQVWTVAEAWLQHEPATHRVADVAAAVGLTVRDVETALAYWADYRDEIDDLISRHHADQDDALAAWERRRSLDTV
ncbi:MAG: ribbon-helix-helix protein, CopG family [Acidimicrobiales bacterium]